jgi:CRISPR-associated protein Csb2
VPLETYVPVNDKHGGIVQRGRQPRAFPTVRLYDDKVFLVWDADAPDDIRRSLNALCSKVTRIGHSSSVVQMWVVDEGETIEPTLFAHDTLGDKRMRVPERGTLAHLERAFLDGDRPRLVRWYGYQESRAADNKPVEGPFDASLVVLQRVEGPSLGIETTLQLTSALRNAAMKALPEGRSPEWLSGHRSDGSPSLQPHAAFFPLPFVDSEYADGHIVGLAVAIPRDIPAHEAKRVIGPLLFDSDSGKERSIRLWRKELWEWTLERETRDRPPMALRAETWTRPSRFWGSVTPVVLHHYPKRNRDNDVERIILEAFESAKLPRPKSIRSRSVSVLKGAGHAASIPTFSEGGETLCRYQTHVVAEFEQSVRGPMLVGRGRFRGYGLFRPLEREGAADELY